MNHNLLNSTRNQVLFFGTGLGLLSFLFALLVFDGISILIHVKNYALIGWISILIGGCFSYFWGGWRSLLSFLFCLLIALGISFCSFDTASDSLGYHENTIISLIEGWNPISDPEKPVSLWTRHYARAQELMAANIIALTGIIETGKAVGLLFLFTSAFLVFAYLRKIYTGIDNRKLLIVTLILTLNPVVLSQILTFYNDLYLYPGLLILFFALLSNYLSKTKSRIDWTIALMVTVLLINTKFTHFFYCGLVWLFFIFVASIYSKKQFIIKSLIVGIIAVFIGVGIVGFNPYLTNTYNYGDPFYPLLTGDVDIMTGNTPPIYYGSNRVENFLKSQVSLQNNSWSLVKNPINKLNYFSTTLDSRTMGFGPFYLLLLIFSLFMMLVSKPGKWIWIIYLGSLLLCFIFPQSWWARYVPMAWAPIGISVLASYLSKRISWLRKATIIFVAINLLLVGVRSNAQSVVGNLQWHNFINISKGREIKVYVDSNIPMLRHLEEYGVDYIEVPMESMDSSRIYTIVGNPENEMMPIFELPPDYVNSLGLLNNKILQYSKR